MILEPLYHVIHDVVGQELWKGWLDDSSLLSLAAAGPAGSTQIWFLRSHQVPWCCLASLSLQHRILWVFCVRWEPLMDHILRAPAPRCLHCLSRPSLELVPSVLLVKAAVVQFRSVGRGEKTHFPVEGGSKALQLSSVLHDQLILFYFFFSSFSFWGLLRIQWRLEKTYSLRILHALLL